MTRILKVLLLSLWFGSWVSSAPADEINVAVAANFAAPMKEIAAGFEQTTGHKIVLTFGSSGKFYAQIRNGAPFQLFLSADEVKPAQLERDGLVVPGSRFTYAVGTLVLWSPQAGLVDGTGNVLRSGQFGKLALANPKLAPYGVAAVEVLKQLGQYEALEPKFVQGENIAQTFQFVASGNADLGFVALSQVMKNGKVDSGSAWMVPEALHTSIRQDAVAIRGRAGDAALAFLTYLKTPAAQTVIRAYGYQI